MAGEQRKRGETTMALKRGKLQRTTLHEDLILEIVRRLPLKYAVQCCLINKSILRQISRVLPHCSTIFYSNYDNPRRYTATWQGINSTPTTRLFFPRFRSVGLDSIIFIKASCNGVLFLRWNKERYFIFNPATAGIIAVDHGIGFYASVGLAVSKSCCKLVGVEVGHRLRFEVFVPASDGWMTPKSGAWLDPRPRRIEIMRDDDSQPLYADGSLYWLAVEGKTTVAFDVEKEEARLIEGPVEGDGIGMSKWFGVSNGSIYFAYAAPNAPQIVICHLSGGAWRVEHRISKPRTHDEEPLYFSVGRGLYVFRKSGGGGDIYKYDLMKNLKEKVAWRSDYKPKLFWFSTSFAKVSNYYLKEEAGGDFWKKLSEKFGYGGAFWLNEFPRNALLQLQKLLVPVDTPTTKVSARSTK